MAEKKNIATGYIGNALRSSAADHTTTFTDEVFDTERQKYQSEVNTDIEEKITSEAEARDLAINSEAQARSQNDQLLSQAIVAEQERAEAAEQANAQGIIYDVSVNNNGAVFESLSALLSNSNLNTLIPISVRHGGMSIRFIQGSEQSSDNKYVQYRLMSPTWSTFDSNWQGVDEEPMFESENLVKSGGVDKYLAKLIVTKEDNPNFTQGIVHINGSIEDNTTYGYVAPILLKAKETLFLNQGDGIYQGGNVALVYECNSDGTFIRTLLYDEEHEHKVLPRSYTNPNTDKYVGICGYKAQLKYSIQEKTAAAPNNIFEERTAILADGVDSVPTVGSNKLVTSGGVQQALINKVSHDVQDVSNTENIKDNTWIRYDNGLAQSAAPSGQWTARYYSCEDIIDKLYCKVGSDGPLPVSIAFYNKKPTFTKVDANYYLQEVSIQAQSGVNEYIVNIPEGATWVVISNRGATFDSPIVKLYSQRAIDNAILRYDSELLYQSDNSVTFDHINNAFDISTIENYTQFELEVTEVSGDSGLNIDLCTTFDKFDVPIYRKFDCTVGKYYFEKIPNCSIVRLRKAGVEGNLFNWKIRTITKKYPIQNRTLAPFLPAKQVDTIDLGTPFSGYYSYTAGQDAENTKIAVNYWVSWSLQKTNGFVIKIDFDATQYVVNFSTFDETYQRRVETTFENSPFEIDLSCCRGWNLAIRKIDYTNITPADVEDAITVTKVRGTIYEKPLLKYEVEKIVDIVDNKIQDIEDNIPAIESNTNKALTISKEGYGFNPFVERPFWYHFRANGFITDANDRRAIASQSLDDVELAARLGFGLIEANIHPTSDGHFVVIHGNSGTFGRECKSINPNVISTADLQATAFNSVTLEWIKTNVRYDSYYEKYQTTLPSLEEFCEACKNHNIGIFAGTNNKDAIDICVKYLGQNVVVYNPPTDIRTYFNGWCFIWNNNSATTVDQILASCRSKGAPIMYGLGPSLAAQLYADDNMNTLIDSMHKEGFLIGWTANYDSEENGRKYHKLGMDFSSSENDINPFEANYEVFDIDSDNLPTTTGSISNGIISLANSQTIICGNAAKIIGKAWLSVKFNGTLTFDFGSSGSSGRTITSDGSEDIVITDYFFMKGSTLTVTAGTETTVTKFLYKISKC